MVTVRDELIRSLVLLVTAIGGPEACQGVGYEEQRRDGVLLRQLYVLPLESVRGAILGAQGATAKKLRALLRMRAATLGCQDDVDLLVIPRRDWITGRVDWCNREEVTTILAG